MIKSTFDKSSRDLKGKYTSMWKDEQSKNQIEACTSVKISIVMPLYNAERYLSEAIESIQCQIFTEYELICINDASTDKTLEILEQFIQSEPRIRIYSNLERSGAAYSRNYGMKRAKGRYVTFLDGDDIFDENMLERAYTAAEHYQTDVVMYERMHAVSKDIYHKKQVVHSELFRNRYCNTVFKIKNYMPHEFVNWPLAPSNKLYRRTFIENNSLEFQNLSCANDIYFSCMTMMLSERLLLLDDNRVMVYLRDHEEKSRISNSRDPKCTFQAFVHIAEELIKRDRFSELYPHYYYRFYNAVLIALRQCKTEEMQREFYDFLQMDGMHEIRVLGGEYFDRLDDYIKAELDQFVQVDFESKWFMRQNEGISMWLNQKYMSSLVVNLFQKYKALHKSVGIWGAGDNGVSLLRFCRENGLQIDMVIDKSHEKHGCIVEGYRIKAPEEIDHKLQVIIISSRYIFNDVEEELAGKDLELIDINQFLWIY